MPDPVPTSTSYFTLTLEGSPQIRVASVSGLATKVETVEHKTTDPNGAEKVVKVSGATQYENVTLRRTLNVNLLLAKWAEDAQRGMAAASRNGTISLRDGTGQIMSSWRIRNAWPKSYAMRPGAAGNSDAPIEELVLVAESIERI